jgi:hypothetical protein
MLKIAGESSNIGEIADKALLTRKDAELLLKKLQITRTKGSFITPQNPNLIITSLLKNAAKST